jgi:hypothetical protein
MLVMKLIKDLKRRPFSFGEGIRGMRPLLSKEQKVQECDATKLIVVMQLINKKSILFQTTN